jgi:hypothetical protein
MIRIRLVRPLVAPGQVRYERQEFERRATERNAIGPFHE